MLEEYLGNKPRIDESKNCCKSFRRCIYPKTEGTDGIKQCISVDDEGEFTKKEGWDASCDCLGA